MACRCAAPLRAQQQVRVLPTLNGTDTVVLCIRHSMLSELQLKRFRALKIISKFIVNIISRIKTAA